jgi:chitinase
VKAAHCLRTFLLFVVILICSAARLPNHTFVAYHDSWNEPPACLAQQTSLARLPEYIDLVLLAFAKPDAVYRGNFDISGTGLEYRMTGQVLRDAILLLKHRHAGTRVLLSVGGAAYRRWDHFNLPGIVAFVRDFGLDGMDIDYEPADPRCDIGPDSLIGCATDQMWSSIVRQTRVALRRPLLLTASVWSVGAYGEGMFGTSRPHSPYTGIMLPLLHSPRAADLDLLSINAYDAGSLFDPLEAFRAYRAVWAGPLALGLEVQWSGGAGPFQSVAEAETLAREIVKDPRGGMMLYPLLAMPEGGPANRPSGGVLAGALCRGMGLAGCDATGWFAGQHAAAPTTWQSCSSAP